MRKKKLLLLSPLILLVFALFIALGGEIVRLLWNWLLPPLFGWREVTFWQALGLLVLCRILFGGLGLYGGPRSRIRERIAQRWEQRMSERWERMTPEERERFRQGMRAGCGYGPATSEPPQP